MREDKNETRWDKLLHIRTMGRDDSHSDQHRFPYEPTPYCVLERLANSGYIRKEILWSIMDAEKACSILLSYQTDAILWVLNTMSECLHVHWKTKQTQWLPGGWILCRRMRKPLRCRKQLTGVIFLIHFHWNFWRESWDVFWILIMQIHERWNYFFTIPRMNIFLYDDGGWIDVRRWDQLQRFVPGEWSEGTDCNFWIVSKCRCNSRYMFLIKRTGELRYADQFFFCLRGKFLCPLSLAA